MRAFPQSFNRIRNSNNVRRARKRTFRDCFVDWQVRGRRDGLATPATTGFEFSNFFVCCLMSFWYIFVHLTKSFGARKHMRRTFICYTGESIFPIYGVLLRIYEIRHFESIHCSIIFIHESVKHILRALHYFPESSEVHSGDCIT